MTDNQPLEEVIAALDAIANPDVEEAHVAADQALIRFLDAMHPAISAAWRRVQERYDGFGFAEGRE